MQCYCMNVIWHLYLSFGLCSVPNSLKNFALRFLEIQTISTQISLIHMTVEIS